MDDWKELYQAARAVQRERQLSPWVQAGGVAAAIGTPSGIYVGVCLDTACSLGMCAERAAAANLITQGENRAERHPLWSLPGAVFPVGLGGPGDPSRSGGAPDRPPAGAAAPLVERTGADIRRTTERSKKELGIVEIPSSFLLIGTEKGRPFNWPDPPGPSAAAGSR